MGLLLKFAGICGALALIISLGFGLAGGNRFSSVAITAVVSTLVGAAIGAVVYKLLELRVPEILAPFTGGAEGGYDSSSMRDSDRAEEALSRMDADEADERTPVSSYDVVDAAARESSYASATAAGDKKSAEAKSFGDHVIVGKIKIKNEPKLMAAAVRTMLARD